VRTLNRYIAGAIIRGYLIVFAVLLTLFSFVTLLEELEDVGDRNYTLVDAFLYVLMLMPEMLLNLAPVTALLGSLLAMATLARSSELIAMQVAGVSSMRISWAVLRPAIGLMLISLLLMEYLAPPLYQEAVRNRLQATSRFGGELLRNKGFWASNGDRYINIRRLLMQQVPADIDIYEFEPDGRLRQYLHAERADFVGGGGWRLVGVERTSLKGRSLITEQLPDMEWRPFWEHDPLETQLFPVASLSLTELRRYIGYLRDVKQDSGGAELTYWRKWFQPLRVGVMALLSVSFVFGSLRGGSFGRQIAMGVATGILFFLGSQLWYNLGLVLQLNAPLVALAPVGVVGLTALFLLSRRI
jgi:lipopolysaccharide export system permease protein